MVLSFLKESRIVPDFKKEAHKTRLPSGSGLFPSTAKTSENIEDAEKEEEVSALCLSCCTVSVFLTSSQC